MCVVCVYVFVCIFGVFFKVLYWWVFYRARFIKLFSWNWDLEACWYCKTESQVFVVTAGTRMDLCECGLPRLKSFGFLVEWLWLAGFSMNYRLQFYGSLSSLALGFVRNFDWICSLSLYLKSDSFTLGYSLFQDNREICEVLNLDVLVWRLGINQQPFICSMSLKYKYSLTAVVRLSRAHEHSLSLSIYLSVSLTKGQPSNLIYRSKNGKYLKIPGETCTIQANLFEINPVSKSSVLLSYKCVWQWHRVYIYSVCKCVNIANGIIIYSHSWSSFVFEFQACISYSVFVIQLAVILALLCSPITHFIWCSLCCPINNSTTSNSLCMLCARN